MKDDLIFQKTFISFLLIRFSFFEKYLIHVHRRKKKDESSIQLVTYLLKEL